MKEAVKVEEPVRMDVPVNKLIVAVHGIGDQVRFATAKQVLTQFSRYFGQVAAVPLGHFHGSGSSGVFTTDSPKKLKGFGFTEVYWADIPRKVVNEKFLLEDIGPWVRTIIGRVHRDQLSARPLSDSDQRTVEQVLAEIVETIGIMDRLCFLADKMGVFSFDLKKVLVDYVDDVQIVAEFKQQGGEIGQAFANRMKQVCEESKGVTELYLVTHSEGTVVALLGLLAALSDPSNTWVAKVRGFMTFGSPIDKHLTLWPELFEPYKTPGRQLERPIIWHNYYDFGDPIGFGLETAREVFAAGEWSQTFEFPAQNDHGFARYPLPGKAHNDYWQDEAVFSHFIETVVEAEGLQGFEVGGAPAVAAKAGPDAKVLKDKPIAKAVSRTLPYLVAMTLLCLGVLVLYKAVLGFVKPEESFSKDSLLDAFAAVSSITGLLAGLTVVARIPRLTYSKFWRCFGVAIFLASIAAYRPLYCVGPSAGGFRQCLKTTSVTGFSDLGLVGFALVALPAVYLIAAFRPSWCMRSLLIPGAMAVALVVYLNIHESRGNLWPVLLAGAAFLYLWWLVALLFDLTFVWHRYIRNSSKVPLLKCRRVAYSVGADELKLAGQRPVLA